MVERKVSVLLATIFPVFAVGGGGALANKPYFRAPNSLSLTI